MKITTSGSFLLFLIFLVLKLTHTIDWSWWCITMPLWIIPLIVGIFWTILLCIMESTDI